MKIPDWLELIIDAVITDRSCSRSCQPVGPSPLGVIEVLVLSPFLSIPSVRSVYANRLLMVSASLIHHLSVTVGANVGLVGETPTVSNTLNRSERC